MKTCCGSCRFWDERRVTDHGIAGFPAEAPCVRRAPSRSDHGAAQWPVTTIGDWCGSFQRATDITLSARIELLERMGIALPAAANGPST